MDVKDVFGHTSGQKRKKINSLSMKRKLMPILLLIIWPGFNLSDFQKLLKILIASLRRINVRIIDILDDILVMALGLKESLQTKETFFYSKL